MQTNLIHLAKHLVEGRVRAVTLTLFLDIIITLIPLASAWLLTSIVAKLTNNLEWSFFSLPTLVILFAAITISGHILNTIHTYLATKLGRSMSLSANQMVLDFLSKVDNLSYFESSKYQDFQSLGFGAISQIASSILQIISLVLKSTLIVPIVVILIAKTNIALAALVAMVFIFRVFSGAKINYKRSLTDEKTVFVERSTGYYKNLMTTPNNVKENMLYALFPILTQKFITGSQIVDKTRNELDKMKQKESLKNNILDSIITITVLLYCVNIGDVSKLIFYSAIIIQLLQYIDKLSNTIILIHFVKDKIKYFKDFVDSNYAALDNERGQIEAEALRHSIVFENVCFRYTEAGKMIIQNFNMRIDSGQVVILKGRNGSGKSTIVNLLLKMYTPTSGRIIWDGKDIKTLNTRSYRDRFSAVFQDYSKYHMSVSENIAPNPTGHDDSSIEKIAREADISAWIDGLPRKYMTSLGRWLDLAGDNCTPSGGQWQKLAIARALLKPHDVLILDESSSNLDLSSDNRITDNILCNKGSKTIIIISHREEVLKYADKIIDLDRNL